MAGAAACRKIVKLYLKSSKCCPGHSTKGWYPTSWLHQVRRRIMNAYMKATAISFGLLAIWATLAQVLV